MKFGCLLFTLLCLNLQVTAQAPDFAWGYSSSLNIYDIETDSQNNIYSVGSFTGTADVDPGPLVLNVTSLGQQDIIILKQNSNGDLIWHYHISGTLSDGATSLKFNSNGELIILGFFESINVDFDFGQGNSILNCQGTQKDVFLLKLSANGNFLNAKSYGGQNNFGIEAFDLSIDSQNNIYTTGYFTGTVDMDPNTTGTFFLSAQFRDTYVSKLSNNLDFVWAKKFSSATLSPIGYGGYEKGISICSDNQGNVHIAGEFFGTTDIDPGPNVYNLTSVNTGLSSPEINIFHVKLDGNGGFINGYSIPGIRPKMIKNNLNQIIISGIYNSSSIDFDPGIGVFNIPVNNTSCFLIQMTTDFVILWGKNTGSSWQWIQIDTDELNNIYFANEFGNSIQIDPGSASVPITSQGSSNVLISKYSSNGLFDWVVTYGATSLSSGTFINTIEVGQDLSIFNSGLFGTSADIDPSNSTYIINASPGNSFILKLNQCVPTSSIQNVLTCNPYTAPDGQIYTQSGTYTSNLVNAAGCDSVVTINLTIAQPTTATVDTLSCGAYTSPSGNVWTTNGNYLDTIPNAFGCDSILIINLTINTIDTTVMKNGNTLTANQQGATYQWYNCTTNSPISGATNQSFTANAPGWYAAMVTTNGCSEMTECKQVKKIILTPSGGIAEVPFLNEEEFVVYPNPFNNFLMIDAGSLNITKITLYDLEGRKVVETNAQEMLSLEFLSSGTYQLSIESDAVSQNFTIVKL